SRRLYACRPGYVDRVRHDAGPGVAVATLAGADDGRRGRPHGAACWRGDWRAAAPERPHVGPACTHLQREPAVASLLGERQADGPEQRGAPPAGPRSGAEDRSWRCERESNRSSWRAREW